MITSLRIAHFKAAASVTVPLGPITVLIGPNDSGKSTILQALMALSRATDKARLRPEQLLDCPLGAAPTNHDASKYIQLSAEGTIRSGTAAPKQYVYTFAISSSDNVVLFEQIHIDGSALFTTNHGGELKFYDSSVTTQNWIGTSTELSLLAHAPATQNTAKAWVPAIGDDLRATLLRLDPRAIARPSPLGAPLLADGSGLVGIVDELLTSGIGDDKIARANEVIRKLTPHVKGVAAKLHPSGGKELHFALRSGAVIPASQVSDGVVLAAALVLISLGVGTRRLLIEEPENGLHPRQLRIVADTIRSIATEHGTQIVLTTHSPLLLNHFGAEETVLVTRTESGVSVQPMSKTQAFDELATEMSLGELWYNVGDSHLARPA